eukprot:m.41623 g.41623  ORF g.41623 m.41623 type:complete len:725 (+) comp5681_c0_seq1:93-2267(+)
MAVRHRVPRLLLAGLAQREEEQIPEHTVEYTYGDTDSFQAEIEEFFTYAEVPELDECVAAFSAEYERGAWSGLEAKQQKAFIIEQLDHLESATLAVRTSALQRLLYYALGVFAECRDAEMQLAAIRRSALQLIALGAWPIVLQLFKTSCADSKGATLASSQLARLSADILYIMLCVAGETLAAPDSPDTACAKTFAADIGQDGVVAVLLLELLTAFKEGAWGIPAKKTVLMLWKTVLLTCGGLDAHRRAKIVAREAAALPGEFAPMTGAPVPPMKATPAPIVPLATLANAQTRVAAQEKTPDTSEVNLQTQTQPPAQPVKTPPMPKATPSDLKHFEEHVRGKYYGWRDPVTGEIGVPPSVREAMDVLQKHLYVSLSEKQLDAEIARVRTVRTTGAPVVNTRSGPVEELYEAMYPHMQGYMIAILRVLLAAAPVPQIAQPRKDDKQIHFTAELRLPDPNQSLADVAFDALDDQRLRETIVKGIAGTLLLLLKHFRVNHVLQEAHLATILCEARCSSLALKLLNRDLHAFVVQQNNMPSMDLFHFVGKWRTEPSEEPPQAPVCARNMHAVVSLLRVVQKIVKGNTNRVLVLVTEKSVIALKRCLQVSNPFVQLYALKILKMQVPYLGKGWRKSNMMILSRIDRLVRHRFHDGWFYDCQSDSAPPELKAESDAFQQIIATFNAAFYGPPEHSASDIYSALWLKSRLRLPGRFAINWAVSHAAAESTA